MPAAEAYRKQMIHVLERVADGDYHQVSLLSLHTHLNTDLMSAAMQPSRPLRWLCDRVHVVVQR